MADNYRFAESDSLLCYHGPMLYEAKCLQRRKSNDGKAQYFIHYKGWNSKWEEWVDDNRVLTVNAANMNKLVSLKEIHSNSKKSGTKRSITVVKEETIRNTTPPVKGRKRKHSELSTESNSTINFSSPSEPKPKKRVGRPPKISITTKVEEIEPVEDNESNEKIVEKQKKKVKEIIEEKQKNKGNKLIEEKQKNKVNEILEEKQKNNINNMIEEKPKSKVNEMIDEKPKSKGNKIMEEKQKNKINEMTGEKSKSKVNEIIEEKPNSKGNKIIEEKQKNKINEMTGEKAKSKVNEMIEEKPKSKGNKIIEEKQKIKVSEIIEEKPKSKVSEIINEKSKNKVNEMIEEKPKSKGNKIIEEKQISKVSEIIEEKSKSKGNKIIEEKQISKVSEVIEEKSKSKVSEIIEEKPKSKGNKIIEEKPKSKVDEVIEEKPRSIISELIEEKQKCKVSEIIEGNSKSVVNEINEEKPKSIVSEIIEMKQKIKISDFHDLSKFTEKIESVIKAISSQNTKRTQIVDGNSSSMDSTFIVPPTPVLKIIPIIDIPHIIKKRIAYDHEKVKCSNLILKFPKEFNVYKIIRNYIDSKVDKELKEKACDVGLTLIQYFNVLIHSQLLYLNERNYKLNEKAKNYLDIKIHNNELTKIYKENKLYPKNLWHYVYGPTHLIRLFAHLPLLLSNCNYTVEQFDFVVKNLNDFLIYLANNFELYFTGDYFNPNNQLEGETKE